jgi:uncharacterized protein YpmB
MKGGFKMSRDERDRKKLIIVILSILVVVLLLVLIYFFVVKPSINNFILNKQIEAANIVTANIYTDMINQLQTKGYYQVTLGNQTIILIPPQQTS